jgi:hypothetical protein
MPEKNSNLPPAHPGTQPGYYTEADDEISLKDLILTLWHHRSIIVVWSLSVIFIILAVAVWVYLRQHSSQVVSLEFKLEFEGADKNEYPNGLRFSTADILSSPVLSQVYEENNLKEYLAFPEFKAGLTIIQTNDDLKFLEYEYAEKLSQKNLSLEERDRLEAEFLEKKKNALVPIYTLAHNRDQSQASIPDGLVAKLLNDILRIWAGHADRVKGVNKYQYFLVSRNILSENDLQKEDYFIATDMLRTAIDRVSADIEKLQQIPGAQAIKVGQNAVSLQDLEFRMEDIQQFKLSPLIGLIRQAGVSKDETIALGYLRNRLFELNLKEEAATANVAVYENSLNQYIQRPRGSLATAGGSTALTPSLKQGMPGNVPAMIPQFGASFLDSLIEMAQENSDIMFRQQISEKVMEVGLNKVQINNDQKYYQELYDRITADKGKDDGFETYKKAALARINLTHREIYNTLMQTIDEINAIYLDLSKYNLNPESLLFSLTEPITAASMKSLTITKILLYVILASVFTVFAIVIGVLLMSSLTSARRER